MSTLLKRNRAEYSKAYRASHKDSIKKTIRSWIEKNREHIREQSRLYRLRRPETEHGEKRKEWRKKWLIKNNDKLRERGRLWHKNHREQYRKWVKEHRSKLRDKIFIALGGKCKRCNFEDYRALQIDHVNGSCRSDKVLMKNSRVKYYLSVLKQVTDGSNKYQLLCANCNWIKRVENKEFSDGYKLKMTETSVEIIDPLAKNN